MKTVAVCQASQRVGEGQLKYFLLHVVKLADIFDQDNVGVRRIVPRCNLSEKLSDLFLVQFFYRNVEIWRDSIS